MFGLHGRIKGTDTHQPREVKVEGFDVPLMTTADPLQFDAPGGLKKSLGGYHAWQSRDMVRWVHHGPVTEKLDPHQASSKPIHEKQWKASCSSA